jgi:hypothetical protein
MIARRSEPMVHVVPTGRRHRRLHAIDRDFFLDHVPADVVAGGMPDRYPVIDEFDDDAALPPEVVQATLGLDRAPAWVVPVPGDVLAGDEVVGLLPQRRASTGDSAPEEGDPVGGEVGGWEVVDHAGSARRRGAVVAMDPGARLTLRPPRGAWRRNEVVVLDAPHVRAGVRMGDRAATFEPGRAVELAGGEEARLWNDGPGPLVVRVRRRLSGRRRGTGG